MKVHELVTWLNNLEDQDATVLVVRHTRGSSYYDQGGNAMEIPFDPTQHSEYVDLRNHPTIPDDWKTHTILLGVMND
jgi:hypothetical protein